MPKINPGESRNDFVKRCVPIVLEDGTAKTQEQAVAICHSMYDNIEAFKDGLETFCPPPESGESRDKYMQRCIGTMKNAGYGPNSAAGQCIGAWEKASGHSEDFAELDIEVMSVGTWKNTKFTNQDLQELAENFSKLKELIKPPVKLGHSKELPGQPALGWVDSLKVAGNKLVAHVVNIPKTLMEAIKARRYRRVSSEIYFGFTHNGKKYGRVFSGLALLGADIPAVKDLKDLGEMLLQNADTDLGTFETIQAFAAPVDLDGNLIEEEPPSNSHMEDIIMATEIEKKLEEFSQKLETLTLENNDLKTKNKELETEKAESQKIAFEEKKAKGIVEFKEFCETLVKDGRMLPAQRDLLIGKEVFSEEGELVISIAQFKGFSEMVGKILGKEEFAQDDTKKSDENFENVQAEVASQVEKYMTEHDKLTYSEALVHVLKADTDLAKRYIEDHK